MAGPVVPGLVPSRERVGGLASTLLRPGSTGVLATPGAGTAGELTLGDVGAPLLGGAVVAGPVVPPPPRAPPPLELAPPPPAPWAKTACAPAISQLQASTIGKRMAGRSYNQVCRRCLGHRKVERMAYRLVPSPPMISLGLSRALCRTPSAADYSATAGSLIASTAREMVAAIAAIGVLRYAVSTEPLTKVTTSRRLRTQ